MSAIGRPPLAFSQETADTICERMADGESLRTICADEALPSRTTIFKWLAENEQFASQYARAREVQADTIFDDILEIADDARNDWMKRQNDDGEEWGWKENGEAIRRSQLRIDARKWMAGKLRPKKYGDRLELENKLSASDPLLALLDRVAGSGKRLGSGGDDKS